MAKKAAVFTGTLSPEVLAWLTQHAEELGVSKRVIIEKALQLYQLEWKKSHLLQTFQKVANDESLHTILT